jgi:hypothetical protein
MVQQRLGARDCLSDPGQRRRRACVDAPLAVGAQHVGAVCPHNVEALASRDRTRDRARLPSRGDHVQLVRGRTGLHHGPATGTRPPVHTHGETFHLASTGGYRPDQRSATTTGRDGCARVLRPQRPDTVERSGGVVVACATAVPCRRSAPGARSPPTTARPPFGHVPVPTGPPDVRFTPTAPQARSAPGARSPPATAHPPFGHVPVPTGPPDVRFTPTAPQLCAAADARSPPATARPRCGHVPVGIGPPDMPYSPLTPRLSSVGRRSGGPGRL